MAIDGQTDKMWYVHPVEYYPALKKATTWWNLRTLR
jgi:hypothetical protein